MYFNLMILLSEVDSHLFVWFDKKWSMKNQVKEAPADRSHHAQISKVDVENCVQVSVI